MMTQSLHIHSTWDDGRSTPEEMVLAALNAGMTAVGLSIHSPLPFANDWAANPYGMPAYMDEVRRLQAAYAGRIRVYMGVEWDICSTMELSAFDYVIGTAHHLPLSGFPCVDERVEVSRRMIAQAGSADEAAALYFGQMARLADEPEVDIVGHFDLLTKFDEREALFDPTSPTFERAARTAMEALVQAGKIFEVNTGAMARGYRTTPYPSRELLRALRAMDGRVTITSDAHWAQDIAYAFDRAEELLRACGFTQIWLLEDGGFVPKPL